MQLEQLLERALTKKASDLHITVGIPPIVRINGELQALSDTNALMPEQVERILKEIAKPEQLADFAKCGEIDFSFTCLKERRFRVNAFKQRSFVALAIRILTERVPTLDEFGHPEAVKTLARKTRGLVLVTGPSGSGKSTTLAAMVNLINEERRCHIITLEDPIEYLHAHRSSIVNQREITIDSRSFASALRAALREDPDVILLGEMRDAETIATAITAAETGHLVLATLHTADAAQTIDRIIDAFSPQQQAQVRLQLSLTLQGVVAQQLIKRIDESGRIAAFEILIATPAVRNLVREGKTHQIASAIQTGGKWQMQSMDKALSDLYRSGKISESEIGVRVNDPETLLHLR
ncbi:type IV pilus twitching motility protein PilT [Azotosporobacter soli]|uniref:type IV pilus twitching motility protein PilT n=1 Tax=Azotosporobacter soli TaxID=3055040 RepID=UPI0031FE6F5C